jgi:hypothetical protein
MDSMSHLIPDRFDVLAHNADQQVAVVLHWEQKDDDYTVVADGPWAQVIGIGGDCFEVLTRVGERIKPRMAPGSQRRSP